MIKLVKRTCARCGVAFEYEIDLKDGQRGYCPRKYCEECRRIIKKENNRKYAADYSSATAAPRDSEGVQQSASTRPPTPEEIAAYRDKLIAASQERRVERMSAFIRKVANRQAESQTPIAFKTARGFNIEVRGNGGGGCFSTHISIN